MSHTEAAHLAAPSVGLHPGCFLLAGHCLAGNRPASAAYRIDAADEATVTVTIVAGSARFSGRELVWPRRYVRACLVFGELMLVADYTPPADGGMGALALGGTA
ncbi:MAG: hypothetical protein ACTHMJ_12640 [Thermomicrobiales bacterium]